MNQNVHTNKLVKQLENKVDAMAIHNKMLETQISQVAQQQATIVASAGTFPCQPQPNPKGHANVITLYDGTKLDGHVDPKVSNPVMYRKVESKLEKVDEESQEEPHKADNEETTKTNEIFENETPYVPPTPYKPKTSYL